MGDFNADKCGKTKDVNLLLVSDCDIRVPNLYSVSKAIGYFSMFGR